MTKKLLFVSYTRKSCGVRRPQTARNVRKWSRTTYAMGLIALGERWSLGFCV